MSEEKNTFELQDERTSDLKSQLPNIGTRVYVVSGMYKGQFGKVVGFKEIASNTFVVVKFNNGVVDNLLPVEFTKGKDA